MYSKPNLQTLATRRHSYPGFATRPDGSRAQPPSWERRRSTQGSPFIHCSVSPQPDGNPGNWAWRAQRQAQSSGAGWRASNDSQARGRCKYIAFLGLGPPGSFLIVPTIAGHGFDSLTLHCLVAWEADPHKPTLRDSRPSTACMQQDGAHSAPCQPADKPAPLAEFLSTKFEAHAFLFADKVAIPKANDREFRCSVPIVAKDVRRRSFARLGAPALEG